MSSSSTTACSRSPSPATPATPDSDSRADVVTQEDLAAWCHSLSPAGFLIGEESHFAPDALRKNINKPVKLEDIVRDEPVSDSPAPAPSDASSKYMLSRSPSLSLPMGIEVADLLASARNSITSTKPIPPPLSHIRRDAAAGSQCVVYPPKESCYNLPVIIPSIPEGGTKSRVETQVRLTVDLAHASASSGEPLKYDRVGSWKWLRLPKGTSTKRRARKEAKIDAPPEDTLYLTTEVTCASPPHTRVTCCSSCQGREAKRVARKLAARVRPARSDSESPDDVRIIPGRGKHEDTTNLVQFNCPEVLDFSSGSVVLPLRITCYCRHHREKVGFNVHFSMLDHNGRIVGSGTTRPIMITDDHKSTGVNAKNNQANTADTSPNPEWPYGAVGDLPDSGAVGAKRKNSRADGVDRTKKRTKPYDSTTRSGRTIRRRGSNASFGSAQSPLTSAVATRAPTRSPTPAQILQSTSILHAVEQHASPEPIDPTTAEVAATILAALENPVTPAEDISSNPFDDILMPDAQNQLDLELDVHTFNLDDLTNPSFFHPEPTSPIPMSADTTLSPSTQAQAAVSYMLFNSEPPPPITGLPPPKIHRLIPAMGPTYGGIEVTVLGSNFHPAMQLNCVFGDQISTSTQRWSDNTLVCLLPPSTTPGVVGVWFDGVAKQDDGTPPVLFTYTDETDRALMELALQVVGLKMTGKIEDARNVAMRIVTTTGPEDTPGGMETSNAMQLSAGPSTSTIDARRLLISRAGETQDFERLILNSLAVMDVPTAAPSSSLEAIISHASASGQTLLHLAARLNFTKVTEFLLDHDIDVDARDRNGCTALHHAAMMGSTECARLLIEAGAALDIVDARGKTAAEVAKPGFIGNFHSSRSRRQREWSVGDDTDEEEAEFADVEEDESEDEVRSFPRRRILERRNSKEKTVARRASIELSKSKDKKDESVSEALPPFPLDSKSSEKAKAAEAGIVDEKQMMATVMDIVQRTLQQIQHPNLPQLPMPAWGALPQMPAVFPVYVPTAAFSALWGDKPRAEGEQGVDVVEKSWRAMWEKWLAMSAKTNVDEAPPAYTPREDGEVLDGDVKVKLGESSASKLEEVVEVVEEVPQPEVPQPSTSSHEAISRRVGYSEEVPVPEQEVNSYGYRPTKKQSRRSQKKTDDRMLVLFWVPVLLIGLIWAILHAMRVGLGAVKTVVNLHPGLRA